MVPDGLTLSGLHDVIQEVMGWTDSHLHQFFLKGKRYGVPDPEWDMEKLLDNRKVRLANLRLAAKDTLLYEYDFGDGWEHVLTLEKILDKAPDGPVPVCLKGVRACPPEDCGGIWGYENLLDILKVRSMKNTRAQSLGFRNTSTRNGSISTRSTGPCYDENGRLLQRPGKTEKNRTWSFCKPKAVWTATSGLSYTTIDINS